MTFLNCRSFSISDDSELFQGMIKTTNNTETVTCHLVHKTIAGIDELCTLTLKTLTHCVSQKLVKSKNSKESNPETSKKNPKENIKRKLTDYYKKKQHETQNTVNTDEPVMQNDTVINDTLISYDYHYLFKGSGMIVDTRASVPSSENSIIEKVNHGKEQSYKIVEIREPPKHEIKKTKSPMLYTEQELSQMNQLSLSDDENEDTKIDTKSDVGNKPESFHYEFSTPKLNQNSSLQTVKVSTEPLNKKNNYQINYSLNTKSADNRAMGTLKHDEYTSKLSDIHIPLLNLLTKTSFCSIPKSKDPLFIKNLMVTKQSGPADYGITKIDNRTNSYLNAYEMQRVSQTSSQVNKTTSNISISQEKIHDEADSDIELVSCVEELEKTLESFQKPKVPKNDNENKNTTASINITNYDLKFETAKSTLEKDILKYKPDVQLSQIFEEPRPSINSILKENKHDTSASNPANGQTAKISYLNTIFLEEYDTPSKKKSSGKKHELSYSFQAGTLSEFHTKLKMQFPNISIANIGREGKSEDHLVDDW